MTHSPAPATRPAPRRRTPQAVRALGCLALALPLLALVPTASATTTPATASVTPPVVAATTASTAAKALPRNRCARTRLGAPRCGVLWGMYLRPDSSGRGPWKQHYRAMERRLGRRLDIVKTYADFSSGSSFPNSAQRSLATHGRLWEVSWNAKDFSSSRRFSYAAIARGDYDATVIRPQARAYRRFGHRVIVDFNHEPEINTSQKASGTPADYVAAFRHIVRVFRRVGADNVRWAWVVGGWTPTKYAPYYPGNRFVDWVGYDPYNFYSCHGSPWRTPRRALLPFYQWVAQHPAMRRKPMMLGEYGSLNGTRSEAWYGRLGRVLGHFPHIKAVLQWGSAVGSCDFRLTASAPARAGFRRAGLSDYVLGR